VNALTPRVGHGALRVWARDAAVYRKTWKVSFVTPFVEPLLYLFAFGVGLAGFVGRVPWEGEEVPYLRFIAPALVAVNAMNNAFFETTYASFVRMHYQRTFDAMLATPLNLDEVITGEILWAATKALVASGIMLAVIAPFGLAAWPWSLGVLPLAFLGGLAFGSAGMFFTGIMPTIETFNLPVFLFITPMFLLSGTFFPLEGLPSWAQRAAWALPLTHLTAACRELALGRPGISLIWETAYLVAFTTVFYLLALRAMRRRLIR
jgi:lipooligosaccharide transport system permease protein